MSEPFALDNWMARFITEHSSIPSEQKKSTLPSLEPVLSDMQALPGLNGNATAPTDETTSHGPEWDILSTLLSDRSLTSEAVVNNALDWLLE